MFGRIFNLKFRNVHDLLNDNNKKICEKSKSKEWKFVKPCDDYRDQKILYVQCKLQTVIFFDAILQVYHLVCSRRSVTNSRKNILTYISFTSYGQPIRISNFYNEIFVYLLFEFFLQGKVFLIFLF